MKKIIPALFLTANVAMAGTYELTSGWGMSVALVLIA